MARRKQDTLVLFPEVYTITRKMTDAQFGALMRAVFEYRLSGNAYEGEDLTVELVFGFLQNQLERYNEICEINRNNRTVKTVTETAEDVNEIQEFTAEEIEVQRNETEENDLEGNAPRTRTLNRTHTRTRTHDRTHTPEEERECVADKPPSPPRFIPPTVEQVRQYATETGYFLDSQRFVDYYTSIGWMVGKAKMKDWKAAVRNWSGKENGSGKAEAKPLWTIGTVL